MTTTSPVGRSIQRAAVDRLRQFLDTHDDQRVFTLVEVAEATAMDPNTVEATIDLLADSDGHPTPEYTVTRQTREYGEHQWTVQRKERRTV